MWGRRRSPSQCHVDEEWQGLFIGRKFCSTHQQRWDDGGPCPDEGKPRDARFANAERY